jgi:hypothetical protein
MNRFPKILLALTLTSGLLFQPACQAGSQAESQADGQNVSAQPAKKTEPQRWIPFSPTLPG